MKKMIPPVFALTALCLFAITAQGTNGYSYWDGDTSTEWTNTANWVGGTTPLFSGGSWPRYPVEFSQNTPYAFMPATQPGYISWVSKLVFSGSAQVTVTVANQIALAGGEGGNGISVAAGAGRVTLNGGIIRPGDNTDSTWNNDSANPVTVNSTIDSWGNVVVTLSGSGGWNLNGKSWEDGTQKLGYDINATNGTVTMSAANTHRGSMTITAGTLALSGNGTLGATNTALTAAGGILNLGGTRQTKGAITLSGGAVTNGTLVGDSFDGRSGAVSAALAGPGALTKTGTGTLTLSGNNTYTGGTLIAGGTLQIGAGGASGSLVGNIINNALLAFNRSDNITYANVISGTGGLVKAGPGILVLSGTNTFTGGMAVNTGKVSLSSRFFDDFNRADVVGTSDGTLIGPNYAMTGVTAAVPTFQIINGQLAMAGSGNNSILVYRGFPISNSGPGESFTLSADIKAFSAQDGSVIPGLAFNIQNATNFYAVRFSNGNTAGSGMLQCYIQNGGAVSGPVNVSTPWVKTNGVYTLTVASTNAGVFNYSLSGGTNSVSGTWTVANPAYTNGYAGLYDNSPTSDPRFDNFSVASFSPAASNRLSTAGAVAVASDAVLDLGGSFQTLANVGGSGTVSNGTLSVTGAITPGGEGTVGTLTVVANAVGLSGKLRVDVAASGASDTLAVAGNVDLSGSTLEVANPAALDRQKVYTVLTCAGTRTGIFAGVTAPVNWHLLYLPTGTVQLISANGTRIQLL